MTEANNPDENLNSPFGRDSLESTFDMLEKLANAGQDFSDYEIGPNYELWGRLPEDESVFINIGAHADSLNRNAENQKRRKSDNLQDLEALGVIGSSKHYNGIGAAIFSGSIAVYGIVIPSFIKDAEIPVFSAAAEASYDALTSGRSLTVLGGVAIGGVLHSTYYNLRDSYRLKKRGSLPK